MQHTASFLLFALALATVGAQCNTEPGPITPEPEPPPAPSPEPPPPPRTASCGTACDNLRDLGGCGIDLDTCVADCLDTQAAEAEVDRTHPVACLTDAPDCVAARRCR